MARARNIKPGFWSNEDLVELPFETRLLFIVLWNLADKAGRLQDRPKKIKIEIFPADNLEVSSMLDALAKHGLITRYSVDGRALIQITNFLKHQRPHHKEPESELPSIESADNKPNENPSKTEGSASTSHERPMHDPSTDHERSMESASCPPDSLIPDTGYLIPDTGENNCASGDAPPDISAQAIAYLNEKAGRNFKAVPASTKLIHARAKEGATLEDFRAVIDRKCAEWLGSPKFEQYLRPATLFNAEKFNNYIGQLGAPVPASNLVDGTSRFAGRQSVDEHNQEVALRWAAGGDCYDQE